MSRENLHLPYPVRLENGRSGICFAVTAWGRGNIRWYWVRHDDDRSEKAYSATQIRTRL